MSFPGRKILCGLFIAMIGMAIAQSPEETYLEYVEVVEIPITEIVGVSFSTVVVDGNVTQLTQVAIADMYEEAEVPDADIPLVVINGIEKPITEVNKKELKPIVNQWADAFDALGPEGDGYTWFSYERNRIINKIKEEGFTPEILVRLEDFRKQRKAYNKRYFK